MAWPTESEHQDLIARFHEGMVPASELPAALFNYYSKDRLMSLEARRDWVEPDLRALDGSSA